ncbi:MAG: class I SAM-dependent methyltransferase [Deltaproteobacteria bacterium]|nr:class I SAM-dependent methyltransferase [Deltaproteobacteria bacterium]
MVKFLPNLRPNFIGWRISPEPAAPASKNRREVRKLSEGRRVLNLFCHTGAFTVAALRGGARGVVSVDLSKNYLAWLDRNLRLNGLEGKSAENLAMDAFDYLEKAAREEADFDLILLDPPTFGRGKNKTFSTERDYGVLLEGCLDLLSPKGRLLACLNTRKVGTKAFRDLLKEGVRSRGRRILQPGGRPGDFDGTEEPPLKAFWIG